MTRALADVDDTVTKTIWWLPINNLDRLWRNLEQEEVGRQEREGENERLGQGGGKERKESKKWTWTWTLLPEPSVLKPHVGLHVTRFTDKQFLEPPTYQGTVNKWWLLAQYLEETLRLNVQTEGTLEDIHLHPGIPQLDLDSWRSLGASRWGWGWKLRLPAPGLCQIQHTTSQPGGCLLPSPITTEKILCPDLNQNSLQEGNMKDF
jgi:hypothetical protein